MSEKTDSPPQLKVNPTSGGANSVSDSNADAKSVIRTPDIVFDADAGSISFKGLKFIASNNPARTSNGCWPAGTFVHHLFNPHSAGTGTATGRVQLPVRIGNTRSLFYGCCFARSDGGPDTKFGCFGNYMFDVPNRTCMGIHSGRASSTDSAGRFGVQHETLGCIRTTDEAMKQIRDLVKPVIGVTTLCVVRRSAAAGGSAGSCGSGTSGGATVSASPAPISGSNTGNAGPGAAANAAVAEAAANSQLPPFPAANDGLEAFLCDIKRNILVTPPESVSSGSGSHTPIESQSAAAAGGSGFDFQSQYICTLKPTRPYALICFIV